MFDVILIDKRGGLVYIWYTIFLILNYIDITTEWINGGVKGEFIIMQEVEINNRVFKVGNKGVRQCHYQREVEVGRMLAEKCNYVVKLVPEITGDETQQYISTPDYFLNDIAYELKRIKGKGKATFYHAAINAKKQAQNIIFDISKCSIDENSCKNRIKDLYENKFCKFMDISVLIKNRNVIAVYKRK